MVCQALSSDDPSIWLIDSGCTSHMTRHLTDFTKLDGKIFASYHTTQSQVCPSCAMGKIHKKPFPQIYVFRATNYCTLDISGPISIDSLGENQYFVLFIDDFIRMTWVYFLRHIF